MMEHMFGRYFPGFSRFPLPLVMLLGFAGSFPAQSIPSDTPARERTALAESFTAERLWVWQKRLNLQDEDLVVIMSRTTILSPRRWATFIGTRTRKAR